MISNLIKNPKHSLIHQSFHSEWRRGPLNGDGFGMAWYQHKLSSEPALFRSVKPAWNDTNLIELSRMIESTCVLAHIRAATQKTEVSELNCHPFKYGKYSFMHNGDIGGFPYMRRELCDTLSDPYYHTIRGTTDSEHFFALLMNFMDRGKEKLRSQRMMGAMNRTLEWFLDIREKRGIKDHLILNSVFTDGHCAITTRFGTEDFSESLFINIGNHYECHGDQCYMVKSEFEQGSTLISSEPLCEDSGWQEVPINTVTLVEEGTVEDQVSLGMATVKI